MSKHQFVTQTNLRWKWRRQRRAKSNHSDKQQQQQQLNCIVCTNYENPSHTHTHTKTRRQGGRPPTKAKGKGNVEGLLSFWHILMRIYKTASLASLSLSSSSFASLTRGHWQLVNFNFRCRCERAGKSCQPFRTDTFNRVYYEPVFPGDNERKKGQ